jgi:flavin reductase (DIM6/NTAB) family NADH-FMN oxidoreductase RutF
MPAALQLVTNSTPASASHAAFAGHTVFFGRVRAARSSRTGAPLVYQRRAYATLADPAAVLTLGSFREIHR